MYSEIKSCIICNGSLKQVLDLGRQYVVDFVKEKDESLLKAPLTLMRCEACSFIQLKHRVNPDRLYKKFWYRSGINEQMKKELDTIVRYAQKTVDLSNGDKVLDIGCNDGTLLGNYGKGITTFGVDPCTALVQEGLKTGKIDIGISDFFSRDAVNSVCQTLGVPTPKFKIITAISCFYDVTNPVEFLKDCKELLHDEGVLIIQMNYLVTMLRDTAFDNICHEHVGYYSVSTLKAVVEKAGLDLQGVEESTCNGGSIRAYITQKGNTKFSIRDVANGLWLYTKMMQLLLQEMKLHLDTVRPYIEFEVSIHTKLNKIKAMLTSNDLVTYVYGASTRGTVLMQALCQDGFEERFTAVAERDHNKFILKMVGTWLDIVPEDEFRSKATQALVLPWHFRESITKREHDWLEKGGKLIFPLPDPVLVEKNVNSEMSLTSTKL